jgi:8-oxo-dGTP pyrophosphatase MutT (NUDIX family)
MKSNPPAVPAEPQPSATVVVLRDTAAGLEVLLLQRSAKDGGDGGAWVFPGGRVDPQDHRDSDLDSTPALLRGAVRETREEAGIELDMGSLLYIARWITPEIASRRYDTHFFATRLTADTRVRVDGEEIRTHRWFRPEDALQASRRREIRLAPPTFVTTDWLAGEPGSAAALETLARGPLVTFRPRICPVGEEVCMLYPGDAGYPDSDPELPGTRHRLWSRADGMHYERCD